jgi:hypothetical protein
MSQSPKTSAAAPEAIEDAEPNIVKDGLSHAPVIITKQEVVFSTAAAMSPRPPIRVVGAALQPRPARRHYPQRISYLEQSRMSREMDRL